MRIALRGASSSRALRLAAKIFIAVAVAHLSVTPAAAQDSYAAEEALKKGDLTEAKTQFGLFVKRNPADYNAVLSYASTLPPNEALKLTDSLSRAAKAPGWVRARGLRFSGDHHFLREDYKKAAAAYLQALMLDTASMYKHQYALSMALDGQTEVARAIWNEIAADKANEFSGEAARFLTYLPKPIAVEAAPVNLPVASVNQPPPPAPVNPPALKAPSPLEAPSNSSARCVRQSTT